MTQEQETLISSYRENVLKMAALDKAAKLAGAAFVAARTPETRKASDEATAAFEDFDYSFDRLAACKAIYAGTVAGSDEAKALVAEIQKIDAEGKRAAAIF